MAHDIEAKVSKLNAALDRLERLQTDPSKEHSPELLTLAQYIDSEFAQIQAELGAEMEDIHLPEVASVVYLIMLQKLQMKKEDPLLEPTGKPHEIIRARLKFFQRCGLKSVEEMQAWIEDYPRIVAENVDRKKDVSGDEVVSVMQYAKDPTKVILGRGFRLLFGIEWTEWDKATDAMKSKLLNKDVPPARKPMASLDHNKPVTGQSSKPPLPATASKTTRAAGPSAKSATANAKAVKDLTRRMQAKKAVKPVQATTRSRPRPVSMGNKRVAENKPGPEHPETRKAVAANRARLSLTQNQRKSMPASVARAAETKPKPKQAYGGRDGLPDLKKLFIRKNPEGGKVPSTNKKSAAETIQAVANEPERKSSGIRDIPQPAGAAPISEPRGSNVHLPAEQLPTNEEEPASPRKTEIGESGRFSSHSESSGQGRKPADGEQPTATTMVVSTDGGPLIKETSSGPHHVQPLNSGMEIVFRPTAPIISWLNQQSQVADEAERQWHHYHTLPAAPPPSLAEGHSPTAYVIRPEPPRVDLIAADFVRKAEVLPPPTGSVIEAESVEEFDSRRVSRPKSIAITQHNQRQSLLPVRERSTASSSFQKPPPTTRPRTPLPDQKVSTRATSRPKSLVPNRTTVAGNTRPTSLLPSRRTADTGRGERSSRPTSIGGARPSDATAPGIRSRLSTLQSRLSGVDHRASVPRLGEQLQNPDAPARQGRIPFHGSASHARLSMQPRPRDGTSNQMDPKQFLRSNWLARRGQQEAPEKQAAEASKPAHQRQSSVSSIVSCLPEDPEMRRDCIKELERKANEEARKMFGPGGNAYTPSKRAVGNDSPAKSPSLRLPTSGRRARSITPSAAFDSPEAEEPVSSSELLTPTPTPISHRRAVTPSTEYDAPEPEASPRPAKKVPRFLGNARPTGDSRPTSLQPWR
ncbi:hypothetical protein FN846DRAFT_1023440 [Sphaerosporella brunnea]|uniref:Uncharacterized protein n=1 Tax=Sphaerosporella brunnea TaxID=1250544 RepID=A0A5J5EQT8_9PEZI|nr:hypothetical protein FN846DRAFT_1023440 [Sphaerosporella brunnea]